MKERTNSVKSDLTLFRNNLSAARAVMGYSVKEVAEKSGLRSQDRLYDLEEGRCPPSLQEVINLSQVLNISIDDLLFGKSTLSFIR